MFFIAIWGAYLIRSLELWSLGMVTFWTTRVGPVFDVFFTAELLLSGRLVPLSLMPDWAQQLANYLPFKWTFSFPIEALIGGLPNSELIGGLLDAAALDRHLDDRRDDRLALRRQAVHRGGRLT